MLVTQEAGAKNRVLVTQEVGASKRAKVTGTSWCEESEVRCLRSRSGNHVERRPDQLELAEWVMLEEEGVTCVLVKRCSSSTPTDWFSAVYVTSPGEGDDSKGAG